MPTTVTASLGSSYERELETGARVERTGEAVAEIRSSRSSGFADGSMFDSGRSAIRPVDGVVITPPGA